MGGCGCKNKGQQTQGPAPQSVPQQKQQTNTPNIQESIKKVVEKYYNKKK
jgi:hypothetical protein